MYRPLLFTAIPGAHPSGQLKLFKFVPDEFVGGRFTYSFIKSQALLDEAEVLACMAYVDYSLLTGSPIRAKRADTPEQSDHTGIQLRISAALKGEQPNNLLPFIGNERQHQPKGIAFSLKDYLELVDDTGRVIRNDKRGAISANSAKLLTRLNIPAQTHY